MHSYSNMTRIIINPFGRSLPIQKRVWILLQIHFVSKMNCEGFIKQNACEKNLLFKILISSRFKSVTLKMFWETKFALRKFYLSKEKHFVLENWKQVSKPFNFNLFLIFFVLPNKGFSKDFGFQNLPQGPTPTWNIIMMINLLISTLARGEVTECVISSDVAHEGIKDHSLG